MKLPKRHKLALDIDNHLDVLFKKGINLRARIITIFDEIDAKLFALIDAALTEFEHKSKRPVIIRICSSGGDVYSALAIVGRMKRSKCVIITEGYGQVMSAATLIMAAGSGRRISKYAWFMHHQTTYSVSGKHSDVEEYVTQCKREELQWSQAMAAFSKKPAEFWLENGLKDSYFSASELVKLGVADAII